MITVLTVNHGMKIGFADSPQNIQYQGVRAKSGWLGIRIMCPSGATCLPVDCCFFF